MFSDVHIARTCLFARNTNDSEPKSHCWPFCRNIYKRRFALWQWYANMFSNSMKIDCQSWTLNLQTALLVKEIHWHVASSKLVSNSFRCSTQCAYLYNTLQFSKRAQQTSISSQPSEKTDAISFATSEHNGDWKHHSCWNSQRWNIVHVIVFEKKVEWLCICNVCGHLIERCFHEHLQDFFFVSPVHTCPCACFFNHASKL